MNRLIWQIADRMVSLYAQDAQRIQHFTKVHAYAAFIGQGEGLPDDVQEILEAAALVHDIGIHRCEELYGSSAGKLQEQEGPALAEELLQSAGAGKGLIDRACFLVAHHHTYEADSADWQILLEADFLVNAQEHGMNGDAIQSGYREIFRTETGKALCRRMFGLEE